MPTPLLANLLPTPQECRFGHRVFKIDSTHRICISSAAGEADIRTANTLAKELAAATGLHLPIHRVPWYVGQHFLRIGPAASFQIPPNWVPPHAQAYGLRIDEAGILLAASDAPGLFYASRTLAQILRLRKTTGPALPTLDIRDWPALQHRGVMLDIARQVERPDYMQTFIRQLADYKANMFVLYFEDKFRWKKHAALSHPLGYTPAQFRELARLAEDNHMEFIPALASLGHCEGILRHPEIAHLREDGAIYQLSLRHPGTRTLLADLYAEILPLYKGKYFHVNCDESPLLKGPPGAGPAYLKESLRLFADHLMFLHHLLAKHGKQMMMWGDMLLHYPEIMAGLSRDIIIVDWDYGPMAHRKREAPETFRNQGFRVMVGPAVVRSAEVCFPQCQLMADNIPYFIRRGCETGAMGSMTTLWELFSTNSLMATPGLVSAAQYAWNPRAIEPKNIQREVAAHLNGPAAAAPAAIAYECLSSHLFLDRQVSQANDPKIRPWRTYHLDSHEFIPTDPMVYLTYKDSPWANAVSKQAWRGIKAIRIAIKNARWGKDDLIHYETAGLIQAFQADRRIAVNRAGQYMVTAERAQRRGNLTQAAKSVGQAASLLDIVAQTAADLIPRAAKMWNTTKHPHDEALELAFLRRFRWTRDALRRHVKTLNAAAAKLAAAHPVPLSGIFGRQRALVFRVSNPSPDLIDLLKAHITFSHDGKTWDTISHKNWFLLESQTYITATIPPPDNSKDCTLPKHIRLSISRTDIDPQNNPLAARYELLPARTLTPAEILDGPPQADIETIDWRLLFTPAITYRLTNHDPWQLNYERVAVR